MTFSKVRRSFLFLLAILGIGYFFGGSFSFFSLRKDPICNAIEKMSTEEKFFLDYFFRELLLRDRGAYVLNGAKPAALGGSFFPRLETTIFFGNRFLKKEIFLKKGYITWKKYQDLFPMTRYLLICNEDKNGELFHVLLINKKSFLDEVAKNIEDFKKILGSSITPELVLSDLIQKKESFYEALHYHSALEGIILGFGKHNSWLFYRRDLLSNRNCNYQLVPKRHELIENELNLINKQLQFCNLEKNKLCFAPLPCFLSDPENQETHQLHQKYVQSRREFTRYYRKGKFLEDTLRKLAS